MMMEDALAVSTSGQDQPAEQQNEKEERPSPPSLRHWNGRTVYSQCRSCGTFYYTSVPSESEERINQKNAKGNKEPLGGCSFCGQVRVQNLVQPVGKGAFDQHRFQWLTRQIRDNCSQEVDKHPYSSSELGNGQAESEEVKTATARTKMSMKERIKVVEWINEQDALHDKVDNTYEPSESCGSLDPFLKNIADCRPITTEERKENSIELRDFLAVWAGKMKSEAQSQKEEKGEEIN